MHAQVTERRPPRPFMPQPERPSGYAPQPYAASEYQQDPYYGRYGTDRRYNEPPADAYHEEAWREERGYYERPASPERYDGYRRPEEEGWARHTSYEPGPSSEPRSAVAWDRSRRSSTSSMFEPSENWKQARRERRPSDTREPPREPPRDYMSDRINPEAFVRNGHARAHEADYWAREPPRPHQEPYRQEVYDGRRAEYERQDDRWAGQRSEIYERDMRHAVNPPVASFISEAPHSAHHRSVSGSSGRAPASYSREPMLRPRSPPRSVSRGSQNSSSGTTTPYPQARPRSPLQSNPPSHSPSTPSLATSTAPNGFAKPAARHHPERANNAGWPATPEQSDGSRPTAVAPSAGQAKSDNPLLRPRAQSAASSHGSGHAPPASAKAVHTSSSPLPGVTLSASERSTDRGLVAPTPSSSSSSSAPAAGLDVTSHTADAAASSTPRKASAQNGNGTNGVEKQSLPALSPPAPSDHELWHDARYRARHQTTPSAAPSRPFGVPPTLNVAPRPVVPLRKPTSPSTSKVSLEGLRFLKKSVPIAPAPIEAQSSVTPRVLQASVASSPPANIERPRTPPAALYPANPSKQRENEHFEGPMAARPIDARLGAAPSATAPTSVAPQTARTPPSAPLLPHVLSPSGSVPHPAPPPSADALLYHSHLQAHDLPAIGPGVASGRKLTYGPAKVKDVTPSTVREGGGPAIATPVPPALDAKTMVDALRYSIITRIENDKQTYEELVNPVLTANQILAEPVPEASQHEVSVVTENAERWRQHGQEDSFRATQSSLVLYFMQQQVDLNAKVVQLREEYLELHEQWVLNCEQLDDMSRAPDPDDSTPAAAVPPSRATRRSVVTLGDAVRSDLEMEQIIASLGNEDLTDANTLAMRNLATIPDMISVSHGRVDHLFEDSNDLVDDPADFYAPDTGFDDWTDEEIEIFMRQFAATPKQFGIIADSLPHKTPSQCVAFYYLRKRQIDFRKVITQFAPGKRRRGGRRTKQKGNALMADIVRHDDEVMQTRVTRVRKPRQVYVAASHDDTATPTPEPELAPRQRKKRAARAPAPAGELDDGEDEDDAGGVKKGKRARKPRASNGTPDGPSPPPEALDQADPSAPGRRKLHAWTDEERDRCVKLLSQYGDDFKRVGMNMPGKTAVQVSTFFKAHQVEYRLDELVARAPRRSPSPNSPAWRELFGGGHPAYAGKHSHSIDGASSSTSTPVMTPAGYPYMYTQQPFAMYGAQAAAGPSSVGMLVPDWNAAYSAGLLQAGAGVPHPPASADAAAYNNAMMSMWMTAAGMANPSPLSQMFAPMQQQFDYNQVGHQPAFGAPPIGAASSSRNTQAPTNDVGQKEP